MAAGLCFCVFHKKIPSINSFVLRKIALGGISPTVPATIVAETAVLKDLWTEHMHVVALILCTALSLSLDPHRCYEPFFLRKYCCPTKVCCVGFE